MRSLINCSRIGPIFCGNRHRQYGRFLYEAIFALWLLTVRGLFLFYKRLLTVKTFVPARRMPIFPATYPFKAKAAVILSQKNLD